MSLMLQDEYEVNIPVLLFCSWAAHYYSGLSAADDQKIQGLRSHWDMPLITPLRQIRRQMKQSDDLGPADLGQWNQLREGVKKLELQAEQGFLESLQAVVATQEPRQGSRKDLAATVIQNIQTCFPELFQDKINVHLLSWLQAAFPTLDWNPILTGLFTGITRSDSVT